MSKVHDASQQFISQIKPCYGHRRVRAWPGPTTTTDALPRAVLYIQKYIYIYECVCVCVCGE